MWTIFLLVLSNVFMTFAWYGHLKFFKEHTQAMWVIILFSWGIAFFEYCLMVPANRMGKENGFSTPELKVMQEIITLVVFAFFSILFMKEKLQWNHTAGFICIVLAGFFVFNPWFKPSATNAPLDQTPQADYSAGNTSKES